MKILFISNLFPPNAIGGYERLCAHVANNFSKEYEVVVLTSDFGDILADKSEDLTVYRTLHLPVGENSIYDQFSGTNKERIEINKKNITELKKVLEKEKPDAVFVWNLYFFDKSLLDFLEGINKRVVYFLTDNWLISFIKPNYLGSYFSKIYRASDGCISQFKFLARKIRYIFRKNKYKKCILKSEAIFSSKFMSSLYSSAGIKFSKSSIIYNGVSLGEDTNCDIDRSFNNNKLKILFAGRLVYIKGAHILIRAFSKLIKKQKSNDISLTIIGDSEDAEYVKSLHKMVDDYRLKERVNFKGFVEESDLFGEFQKYDIYVFPSLYEPFSLTLIHALASGIPTISSNAGGNPEIVIDRKTGLLYNKFSSNQLMQKLKFLIENQDIRREISYNGREKAKEFRFDDMCKNLLEYFK